MKSPTRWVIHAKRVCVDMYEVYSATRKGAKKAFEKGHSQRISMSASAPEYTFIRVAPERVRKNNLG